MRERKRTGERSRDTEEGDRTVDAAGTQAGRGKTAGARGAHAARERPAREHLEEEAEGVAGEGEEESGTLPGSFGGTTGTSGRAQGIQAPGATAPPLPGVDPAEMRRRRAKRDRRPE